ncbi:DUF6240 domain-containing protein [Anoxynatronum buryatiense]|uniref:Flagellar hook-length control protein FliK n=1 Tax=Anoxynatronum buryatiense TaxID=489973 RepID=A0AA46AK77_9CLOT|nr:DUF6240 domain-containing protein [Anoxynatronum buryatiense]SMP67311.1 hypothetical protein SAMN06296020_11539 [Anoxynatronum buryatiense]
MISSFFDKINAPVRQPTYGRPDNRQALTGVLLEKNGREVSVLVSDARVVKALLKEPLQQEPGEKVAIDRRQIEQMETQEKKTDEKMPQEKMTEEKTAAHPADKLLERLQVPVNEDTRKALENLEKFGLEVNRGNLMALTTAKSLLEQVTGQLTHEKALKLLEQQIDLERTSLQELAQRLREMPEEKEKFSFLKFLGLKKEMTTSEAEKQAQKIYGQKMGKDVADAIKALDKQGITISRQQVDRLINLQEKIFGLKDLKDETLTEVLKGKIEPSLENIYKLHRGVRQGMVASQAAVGSGKGYGDPVSVPSAALHPAELARMTDEIARHLQTEGMEVNEERIRMAGVLLTGGVAVTGDTLEQMESLKAAVQLVTEKLDVHLLAALEKAGIQVEKEDIRQLAEWIREHEALQGTGKESGSQASDTTAGSAATNAEAVKATMEQLEQQLDKLSQLDEKQLAQLIRQGGSLRLEQLAPVAERITLSGLSETDQQALRLAQTLGRLSEMNLDMAALHLRRQAPMTLQQLVATQEMWKTQQLEGTVSGDAGKEEALPMADASRVDQVVAQYLAQQGIAPAAGGAHEDLEALRALGRQHLPLEESRVSQLYAMRGAVENLQQMTLDEARQLVTPSSGVVEEKPLADLVPQALLQPEGAGSLEAGFQKIELLQLLQQLTPDALALHLKHDLPLTPEALKLTLQLLGGQIDMEKYRQEMALHIGRLTNENPLTDRENMAHSTDTRRQLENITMPREMDGRMEMLLNRHVAEQFPHASSDPETGALMKAAAHALMAQQMPVKRDSLQQMMQLMRLADDVEQRLHQQGTLPADRGGAPVMQQSLEELMNSLKVTAKEETVLPTAPTTYQLEQMATTLSSLQALAGETDRKESLLSLLIKNATPLTLQEVKQMDLFLQNRHQTGQLLGQMMDLLKEQGNSGNRYAQEAAQQLSRLMEQATGQLRSGQGADEQLYREAARILRDLEPALQQMNPEARENLGQAGERLLNSLELQQQLNREDTVFQLPFMLGGQLQNLQVYFMNQRKNKKIDPQDMTVLLNFDTRHMGNLNVFVGVKYKKIVMKIGVARQEDKDWIDSRRAQLEEMLAAMDFEIKDLSYRVEEEQHLMSLAEDLQAFRGLRHGRLDLRI